MPYLPVTFRLIRTAALAVFCLLAPVAQALDPLSYARDDLVKIKALHLELTADFGRKVLDGHADLTLDWRDPAARTLDLDTRALTISRVQARRGRSGWREVSFKLDDADQEKGQALRITLPFQANQVRIRYRTSPSAPALQWLDPVQTLSGRHPFMFSQSQPIEARSWVPLQDTPAVRFTYTARIHAPAPLRVVMSADNRLDADGRGGWRFTMPQPIPSYLLAIAIGELQGQSVGPRSAVYAEPARLKDAAWELADTERMIEAAERLYGPYRWGRYDMLVLPPSFPIGGMENPRLTFLTPTMIAGDRSLVDLVAHELAHSWSGNLVTNATWKHWWLNEGFTTYVTTRLIEALYGAERATMELQVEQEEALVSLADIEPGKQALLTRDPDTSRSTYTDEGLAYPKGAWFLRTLEQRAGRAAFDTFLRGWFERHAFQSVTTDQFIAYLRTNLLSQRPGLMSEAELDEWLYGPGIPASAVRAASPRLAALDKVRDEWLAGRVSAANLPAKTWNALEWIKFLNDIDNKATAEQLRALDQAFQLARTRNNEVAFRFYRASVHAGYREVREPLRAFLMSVGRQKFVVPLYEALFKSAEDRGWAQEIYRAARPRYHAETQGSVDKKLKAEQAKAEQPKADQPAAQAR